MIIELTWYEPHGGRQYESPMGGSIAAAEHYRIDCVECWYTKIRMEAGKKDIVAVAVNVEERFGLRPTALPSFTGNQLDRMEWFEAVYVQYRCCGDAKPKALFGIGYELRLYGAEPTQPTQVIAQLGPKKETQVKEQKP